MMIMRRLLDFNGVANRKEWWVFQISVGIISWLTNIIDSSLFADAMESYTFHVPWISIITSIVSFPITLAVNVRRLRDRSKSPHLLWLVLLPVLILIVGIFTTFPPLIIILGSFAGVVYVFVECAFLPGRDPW